ncbi:MAG: hypothetical protein LBB77_01950 [Treponema sp.]|jgi:hypothetical protein|nr:hypothetical protein [Treponema sp.]
MTVILPVRRAAAFKTVMVFFLAAFLSGCLSLTEGAGRLLEGKLNHTVRRYRSPKTVPGGRGYQVLEKAGKDGAGLDIRIEALPFVTLKASIPEQNGSFYLKSLDYLAGNPSGWVEFSLILFGEGAFIPGDGGAFTLRLKPPTEAALISGGKIRREGTLLSGEEALRALNNRYERIQALAEWMRQGDAPAGSLEDFESYWKPLLLPELVPRKKRPPLYGVGDDARWVTAEQVRWNAAYTEKILPEELRSLRDSGTLKRDWEESREWIFLIYAWDRIFNTLETSAVELRKK